MKQFLFFCIGFFLITTAAAQEIIIDERKTDVYFGNGVWNNNEDADSGKIALQRFIKFKLAIEDIKVKLAFNHTYGPRRDLIETFYQLVNMILF